MLTDPFVAIYQRGHLKPAPIPCHLPHWTGGQQYDAEYVRNDLVTYREQPMTTERITRHEIDWHTRAAAGDDVPRVWTEEEKAALWEKALVWSGALLGSAIVWYAVIVAVAHLWRRVIG